MDSDYSGAVALGFNTSAPLYLGHARLEPLGTADAVSAGLIGPTNEDVPGDQAEGIKGQAKTDNRDSVAASADQQAIYRSQTLLDSARSAGAGRAAHGGHAGWWRNHRLRLGHANDCDGAPVAQLDVSTDRRAYQMSGGAVLRAKKLKGAGIIRVAAAHNKRDIQAELGAGGSIDISRTALNECLAGAATPDDVVSLARVKMAGAGVGKLRKDAVRAIEFVVSLAPGQCADERKLFVDAVQWLADRFGGSDNILSADIHRDESTPHLHVLLLPLIDGRMVGSNALGGPPQLLKLQADFHAAVCVPYGLKRYSRSLTRNDKTATAAAVLAELKRRCDPCMNSALWPVLRDRIEADPGPHAALLGLEAIIDTKPKKMRTMTQIFTSKGKGSAKPEPDTNHIGFIAPANDRTICSVWFAPNTAPQSAPAAPQIVATVDAVEAASPDATPVPAVTAQADALPDAPPDVVRERDADFAAGTWDADTGEFYPAQVKTRSNKASARAWVAQALQTAATRREHEKAKPKQ